MARAGRTIIAFLNDENDYDHFYLPKEDGTFEPLVYKKYYVKLYETGLDLYHKMIQENEGYKRQLIVYLGNCPTIQPEILKTDYRAPTMVKLFRFYYDCVSQ